MGCPVCFSGDEPAMRESLNAGIGVLLGVTVVVLACFARFFLVLARRARAQATRPQEGVAPARPSVVEATPSWGRPQP